MVEAELSIQEMSGYLFCRPVPVTKSSRCIGCGKGLPLLNKRKGDKVQCAECKTVHVVKQRLQIVTTVELV